MQPYLTPLPASLSSKLTAASPRQAAEQARAQAEQQSGMPSSPRGTPQLHQPCLTDVVLCAEEVVLYAALSEQCGEAGALLAQQAQREHADIGREVDSILQVLLAEQQAWAAPPAGAAEAEDSAVVRDAASRRQALLRRIEALEAAFIAHQAEEEASILPRIATALPVAEQRRLAESFYQAKRNASTLLPGMAGHAAAAEPAGAGLGQLPAASGKGQQQGEGQASVQGTAQSKAAEQGGLVGSTHTAVSEL
ncbi:hypothetical protein ABPG75_006763 [Micractinium tetrahymenae]